MKGSSFNINIRLYHIYSLSALSFIAQLLPLPKHANTIEDEGGDQHLDWGTYAMAAHCCEPCIARNLTVLAIYSSYFQLLRCAALSHIHNYA